MMQSCLYGFIELCRVCDVILLQFGQEFLCKNLTAWILPFKPLKYSQGVKSMVKGQWNDSYNALFSSSCLANTPYIVHPSKWRLHDDPPWTTTPCVVILSIIYGFQILERKKEAGPHVQLDSARRVLDFHHNLLDCVCSDALASSVAIGSSHAWLCSWSSWSKPRWETTATPHPWSCLPQSSDHYLQYLRVMVWPGTATLRKCPCKSEDTMNCWKGVDHLS